MLNQGQEPTPEGNESIWPGVDGGNHWMSPSYNPNTKLLYFNSREERRRFFKTDAPEFRPGEAYFGGGGGGGARFRPEESWGRLIAMKPSYSALSNKDLEDLVAYMNSLRPEQPR